MLNSLLVKVGLPLVAFVASVTAANRPVEPPCVIAKRWVEAHRTDLPTNLTDLSRFDAAHRKAIFVALPQAMRLKLWHEQMAYYEVSPKLTAEQRALVHEIDAILDKYADSAHVRAFDSLYTPRIKKVLGAQLAKQVIANIGVDTPEQLAAAKADQTFPGDCGCSVASDWCNVLGGTNPDSACGGPACNSTDGGCGTFLCYDCNGTCVGII
jgi:hypothetical protein